MLEILEYRDEGYKPLTSFGAWRVAILNYAQRFDAQYFERLERHTKTDEVFILLSGSAQLVIGKQQRLYPMEYGKIYRVLQNVWHHIFVSPDASVAIVENDDTGPENTEYWYPNQKGVLL